MTITVYVSGSSTDLPRAESAIAAVRAAGLCVAYDWPAMMRADDGDADERNAAERAEIAMAETHHASTSDVFWLLGPAGFGSGVECQAAHAGEYAEMVSSGVEHDIFRCDHHFAADAEALAWIVAWAGAQ
jgi:hypothetical protein